MKGNKDFGACFLMTALGGVLWMNAPSSDSILKGGVRFVLGAFALTIAMHFAAGKVE